MPIHVVCATCGNPFKVSPSRYSETRGRFCSRACNHVAKRRSFDPARFWAKVAKSDVGCWEWQGTRTKLGYGRVYVGNHTLRYAHRVSWELTNGPIPDGKVVMHGCDNPSCVRPDHLSLGEQAENVADRVAKGRTHRGEITGNSKLTEAQVINVRQIAAQGLLSRRAIARAFSVSRAAIDDIVNRVTWTHLP